jgi:hypothetical protein
MKTLNVISGIQKFQMGFLDDKILIQNSGSSIYITNTDNTM